MLRRQLRSLATSANKLARTARAKPLVAAAVLAVVVGVVVLVVWLLKSRRRRGRENWQFDVPGKPLTTTTTNSAGKNHWDQIKSFCARGMTWKQITSDDSKSWMKKYNGDDAFKACQAGLVDLSNNVKGKGDGGWRGDPTGKCNFTCESKNRSPCKNTLLRGTHPCMNQGKTRCCDPCGKNCVDASADNYAYSFKPSGSGPGGNNQTSAPPSKGCDGTGCSGNHSNGGYYVTLADNTCKGESVNCTGTMYTVTQENSVVWLNNLRNNSDGNWGRKVSSIWVPGNVRAVIVGSTNNPDDNQTKQSLTGGDKGRWIALKDFKDGQGGDMNENLKWIWVMR